MDDVSLEIVNKLGQQFHPINLFNGDLRVGVGVARIRIVAALLILCFLFLAVVFVVEPPHRHR